jgi:acylphosphatase
MERAEIIVAGDVQGVGYRYFVRRAAWKRGLVGVVENLEDGRVKIICEGEEKEIKAFLEDINIKEPPIFVGSVEHSFAGATGEFNAFKIVTGRLEEEVVEGFSTGAAYLTTVREELKGFREESNTNFHGLDAKYHTVSEDLRSINQNITKLVENISQSNELLAKLVEDYVKTKKK